MGREFQYCFYNEKNEIISRSDYFTLGHCGYVQPSAFDRIEEIFSSDYLESKWATGMEQYGLYMLEELNNVIQKVAQNFTPKQMLTCDFEIEDNLLREIWQLSQLIKDAERHNKYSDNKIIFISFGYC